MNRHVLQYSVVIFCILSIVAVVKWTPSYLYGSQPTLNGIRLGMTRDRVFEVLEIPYSSSDIIYSSGSKLMIMFGPEGVISVMNGNELEVNGLKLIKGENMSDIDKKIGPTLRRDNFLVNKRMGIFIEVKNERIERIHLNYKEFPSYPNLEGESD